MLEPPTAPLKGAALIKDEVRRLPDRPGVYRMIGEDAEVLYVGKARSLKKRVTQYAQGRFHTQRIAMMVAQTRSMEFVSTDTETQALLLECNLIKSLKPRFNVLLRDDKSFAEIVIRRDHAAPQLRKHRGARTVKGEYFGPFASAGAVNRTINMLERAFLLRRFERHLGGTDVGVLVLSVAFGLGHMVQGWDAAITTGVLGAVWAGLYVRRRSSIAPIVSHAGFNSLEVLRVAIVGG